MTSLDSNTLVFFPVFTFFLEGLIFFSMVVFTSGTLLATITQFPELTLASGGFWLFDSLANIANILLYVAQLIYWVLCSIWAIIQVMQSVLSVAFGMSTIYPLVLVFNIVLILMMVSGIIMKIKVAGSGVEG